jgi:hypothetical protein
MKPARFSTRSFVVRMMVVASMGGPALALGGCNDAQAGALLGAGIGALAGQAIGRDTEATLIGTAVGAGAGYVVGNESDKAKSRAYHRY